MSPTAWMTATTAASWPALVVATGGAHALELAAGLAAPLVATLVSWRSVERAHRVHPARVPAVLIHGLLLKILFFSVYLAIMLRVVGLTPAPFVLTFTGAFLALYVLQAVLMHRLPAPRAGASA